MAHKNRKLTYFLVGISITVFNYLLYTFLANVVINNNDFLWLSNLIATFITTFVAYFSHSRITWKERGITNTAKYKFFIWNFIAAFITSPLLTQTFSLLTPVYDFAFNLSTSLHLPFSYDFIQSTGAFVFTGAVTMVLNFLFYDRFVFGEKPPRTPKPPTSQKSPKTQTPQKDQPSPRPTPTSTS